MPSDSASSHKHIYFLPGFATCSKVHALKRCNMCCRYKCQTEHNNNNIIMSNSIPSAITVSLVETTLDVAESDRIELCVNITHGNVERSANVHSYAYTSSGTATCRFFFIN